MTDSSPATPLMLDQLLGASFEPGQYKLHCARRSDEDPLQTFATDWNAWVAWNRFRPARNEFNRPRIFSLMQIEPRSSEWIFGGSFDVIGRRPEPRAFSYDIELVRDLTQPLIGRLHVRFDAPGRATRINLETFVSQIEVVEFSRLPWAGPPFPGMDSINHGFRELELVAASQREDWRNLLDNMKGVYVWNDHATGLVYIGSATSATGGLWSRLNDYISSGHAGNKLLRELITKHGLDYVRDNFTFALLEYWPMRVDDAYVVGREQYWKNVFATRVYGYNAN